MSPRADIKVRIARALVAHAARVAASDHTDWITAMAHELEHLPKSESALSWALGCVLVSYTGRMRVMIRSSADWPRWLLLLEMLVCLGPVTAYFLFVTVSIAQGYTLFPAQGYTQVQEGLIFGSATMIGPIGLVSAFRTLFSRTYGPGRLLTALLWVLAALTLTVFVALLVHFRLELVAWCGMLLPFALLPAAAVAHLAWFGSTRRRAEPAVQQK
jgi:hypothetical protein